MIHDPDAEAAVLGACLSDVSSLAVATELLTPEDFFTPSHRAIFQSCIDLYGQGNIVDTVTVGQRHPDAKPLIFDLLQAYSHSGATERYARIVQGASIKRRLIQGANEIIEQTPTAEAASALEHAERMVMGIADKQIGDDASTLADLIPGALEAIEAGKQRGVGTGFYDLDNLTGGLQAGQMIIVAARPGVGKSSLLADLALNAATQGPVLLFSLEMGKDELTRRFLGSEARIPANRIRDGFLDEGDWQRLVKAHERLAALPLSIDDSPNLSMMDVRSKCRRAKARGGLVMVVLDYIQLMTGDRAENRQQEVSDLSRGFKLLAKEFDVPVIVAAQLNRGLEYRAEKRPMLADLRESGSLEQDADIVAFLYRDALYNNEAEAGATELIVSKHRGGATGTVNLTFLPQYTKFQSAAIERHTREVRS